MGARRAAPDRARPFPPTGSTGRASRPRRDSPASARAGVIAVVRRRPSTCLERALVLQRWEADHGAGRDVIIGVRGPGDAFRAHAWLETVPDGAARHHRGDPPPPGADALTPPLPLTPLEMASGLVLERHGRLPKLPRLAPGTTPRAELEAAIQPALRRAPASSASPAAAIHRACSPSRSRSRGARGCGADSRHPPLPPPPPGRARGRRWSSPSRAGRLVARRAVVGARRRRSVATSVIERHGVLLPCNTTSTTRSSKRRRAVPC